MSQEQLRLAEIIEKLSVEVEPGIRYVFDDTYLIDFNVLSDPLSLSSLNRPLYAMELAPDVVAYNRMVDKANRILVKEDFDETVCDSDDWLIPEEYKTLTLNDVYDRCVAAHDLRGIAITTNRLDRLELELATFSVKGLLPVLRLMCYVVDTLTSAGEVWGVGRGSSVSSYTLFLLGVHDVDSVQYELEFNEFIS